VVPTVEGIATTLHVARSCHGLGRGQRHRVDQLRHVIEVTRGGPRGRGAARPCRRSQAWSPARCGPVQARDQGDARRPTWSRRCQVLPMGGATKARRMHSVAIPDNTYKRPFLTTFALFFGLSFKFRGDSGDKSQKVT
jgi:hypothetical protein